MSDRPYPADLAILVEQSLADPSPATAGAVRAVLRLHGRLRPAPGPTGCRDCAGTGHTLLCGQPYRCLCTIPTCPGCDAVAEEGACPTVVEMAAAMGLLTPRTEQP